MQLMKKKKRMAKKQKKLTRNKEIVKIIFVKNRLVNIDYFSQILIKFRRYFAQVY